MTTASTGSGTGISSAATGTVQIGASDAYLSNTEASKYPGLMNIPLAISSQFIAYNVPNVSGNLKLTGMLLSQIYQGKITNWDDSQIASINPGVSLPNLPIVTVHRSDSSGDTFLFTSFLSDTDPSGWGTKYSYNTSITFPTIPGAEGAEKNSGMLETCEQTKGCIAYIGISYLDKALSAGLGEAELQNKSGTFELPTSASISAEADAFTSATPSNGTISMIYGSAPAGYPIVNYEYHDRALHAIELAERWCGTGLLGLGHRPLGWCCDLLPESGPLRRAPVGDRQHRRQPAEQDLVTPERPSSPAC